MILIPAHNEEESLAEVLSSVQRHAPEEEIVVVASCCSDSTVAIAKHFGATVLEQPQKGYWTALCSGYDYAVQTDAQYLIQLDADGQHPASAIPRLRHQLLSSADIDWVIGSRRSTGTYQSFDRIFLQRLLSRWVQMNIGVRLHDISSGFWAVNRKSIHIFREYAGQNGDVLIRIYGLRRGLTLREIPVPMAERKKGESMHSRLNAGRYLAQLLREWRALDTKH